MATHGRHARASWLPHFVLYMLGGAAAALSVGGVTVAVHHTREIAAPPQAGGFQAPWHKSTHTAPADAVTAANRGGDRVPDAGTGGAGSSQHPAQPGGAATADQHTAPTGAAAHPTGAQHGRSAAVADKNGRKSRRRTRRNVNGTTPQPKDPGGDGMLSGLFGSLSGGMDGGKP